MLDKKDRKILYHLDRNSRESLTSLAKKLKTSKEVIHYRINGLLKKEYLKKFYTIINMAKLGFVAYKIYFQFQNLNAEKEKEILRYFKSHERIFWVATCSGKWDMMLGTWAKNIIDFNDNVLDKILSKYGQYVLSKSITITKHNYQWNRKWFLEHKLKGNSISSEVGGEPLRLEVDEVDEEILKILANNARLPIIEIAKKAQVSPTVAKYRIQQLTKKGILCSFRITPNLRKMGYGFFKSFVYLQNCNSKEKNKLISYCKEHPNVLNVVTCVGSWDFEIELEVEDFEKFHSIMKVMKVNFSNIIKNYESVIISSEPRVGFMPACYPQIKN